MKRSMLFWEEPKKLRRLMPDKPHDIATTISPQKTGSEARQQKEKRMDAPKKSRANNPGNRTSRIRPCTST